MKRDLARLAGGHFDLLVLGGGVHGAAAARAGARLGPATALIDQGDFGHATSANSLKIIHGGLRHLQRGNLRLVREGVRARRSLQALFPGLIAPLPCLIPTSGRGTPGRLAIRVGRSATRTPGAPPTVLVSGSAPAGRKAILARAGVISALATKPRRWSSAYRSRTMA